MKDKDRSCRTWGKEEIKMGEYAVEMLNITKRFPGIVANDNITLQLKKGEIHALLGENGAGKSTLMSVLFGLYQPEEGEIRKDGKTVHIKNPNDANALGKGHGPVAKVPSSDRPGRHCGKYYRRYAAENGNLKNAVPG